MPLCRKCQSKAENGASFCETCGTSLKTQNSELIKCRVDVLLKEYEAMRHEIVERQNQRTNMTYVILAFIGAIYAVSVTKETKWFALVAPSVCFFIVFQVYETYRLHNVQIDYQRKIENTIRQIIVTSDQIFDWVGWQHFFDEEKVKQRVSALARKRSFLLIMWLSIVISSLMNINTSTLFAYVMRSDVVGLLTRISVFIGSPSKLVIVVASVVNAIWGIITICLFKKV